MKIIILALFAVFLCFGASEELCLKGDVNSCEDIAFEAEKAMDIKKAVKFYKKACDLGNVAGFVSSNALWS